MDTSSFDAMIDGKSRKFTAVELPRLFLEWQSEARMRLFKTMAQGGAGQARVQPAHLPVLATWSIDGMGGDFPVNLSTRGMGILPKQDMLATFTAMLEKARTENAGKPIQETLPSRLKAMEAFYGNVDNFDTRLLGGLEIFEGQTAKNMEANPCVSLLYTGEAPKYPSFQFNAIVEKILPGNPHFQFLLAARELFATDAFHLHQDAYPFGYLCKIVEIKDKTPFPHAASSPRGKPAGHVGGHPAWIPKK
ncbi:MAG: hypothetical protein GYA24_01020 [Candidatus Lokiarchaeota archaeon]|nr:hypothetical protein [Candidatus Lokiarchaeota archaeon]